MKKCTMMLVLVFAAGCFEADNGITGEVQIENNRVEKTKIKDSRALTVKVSTRSEDGIFKEGQLMQVYATITNRSGKEFDGEATWKIATDEHTELKEMPIPFKIEPGKEKRIYCPVYDLPGPGFYHVGCSLKNNREGEGVGDSMVVGFCPEKIHQAVTREDDFDTFWQEAIQELKGIDPEYNVILQSEKCTENREVYLVEMKSLGNLTVRGWLEVPKRSGKYPALLRVPGYTSAMEPVNKYDDMVIFSFNVRNHGNSDEVAGAPLELWVRGLDDKNDYYYRGTFMDCIRAMDFLASREEVDTERIGVWGGSQGGGLSFMTASLDDRVSVCIADVPWLCSMKHYFKTTRWEEIDNWLADDARRNWVSMLRTMSYFDTMNMTERITCPVLMGIGLQDKVCPPGTSFASFNKIKSQKEYRVYYDKGHDLGAEHWEFGFKWLRQQFGLK